MKGWVAHHNTDIWAISNPVGEFGKGDPVWANWAMGGVWMSTHLWEHFSFTGDTNFLKNNAYPIMKGAAEFVLDFLVRDKNGKLITSPSTSPENNYISDKKYIGSVLYGGTADLAMIRELFSQLIDAQKFSITMLLSLQKLKRLCQSFIPIGLVKRQPAGMVL